MDYENCKMGPIFGKNKPRKTPNKVVSWPKKDDRTGILRRRPISNSGETTATEEEVKNVIN